MMLADLGATVIKVEAPKTGDDARHIGPFINGKSAYFMSLNRGKHSIALDLKATADRAVFERLLGEADLLVENYRGGTMEKLKYDWPTLHARFPKLIYVAISGFGHTGPYKEKPAYDMVVQGMGGVMSLTGHPGSPPTRVGTSIGDLAAGIFALSGIGAALYHRERTGEAQKLDIAMLDCQVALLENAIARYVATGKAARPARLAPSLDHAVRRFRHRRSADHHRRRQQPIVRTPVRRDRSARGSPRTRASPRTNCAITNHAALTGEMERRAQSQTPPPPGSQASKQAGVPCGPINDVAQVLADPHVLSRNMVVTMHDEDAGTLKLAGNPMKLSAFADPDNPPCAPALDGKGAEIRARGFNAIAD